MKQLFTTIFAVSLLLPSAIWAQCFPDRHSTNWFDAWASCEMSQSPNLDRGDSHWIMYDFGKNFALGQMQVWNTNDPSHLDWGMRNVVIDVSKDGITWEEAGSFTFEQGTGLNTYEGFAGPDIAGVEGQFLLITAESNFGGECFGLSEVRIDAEEAVISSVTDPFENTCYSVKLYPNPFTDQAKVTVNAECAGNLRYTVTDLLGRVIMMGERDIAIGTENVYLNGKDLPAGNYVLNVNLDGQTAQHNLVKIE